MSNTTTKGEPTPRKSANGILNLGGNGQWCKCIKRKVRTFGAASADPTGIAAEGRYFAEREAWERGENPRLAARRETDRARSKCVLELADKWLLMRKGLIATEDAEKRISGITYYNSRKAIDAFRRFKGDDADAMAWTPQTWADCRAFLAKGVSPGTLALRVVYVRAMFQWAAGKGKLLPALPDWGDEFDNVSVKTKREHRYDFQKQHGERLFEIDEAREILQHVNFGVQWIEKRIAERGGLDAVTPRDREMRIAAYMQRAACYIAANCGAYAKDIGCVTLDDIDLREKYLERKRSKTAELWQATLWPETVQYINEYLAIRPEPKEAQWARLLFITADGMPAVHDEDTEVNGEPKHRRHDAIGKVFNRVLEELSLQGPGLGFGAWRHTFCSIASGLPAASDRIINRLMGHGIPGAANSYVRFRPDQLEPITSGVRAVLWPSEPAKLQPTQQLRLVG